MNMMARMCVRSGNALKSRCKHPVTLGDSDGIFAYMDGWFFLVYLGEYTVRPMDMVVSSCVEVFSLTTMPQKSSTEKVVLTPSLSGWYHFPK